MKKLLLRFWCFLISIHVTDILSDKSFIKITYRLRMGGRLNLEKPEGFNEKLQWLKLYDRKPIYTTMVDKFAVKEFVKNIIGDKYLIPTIGVWNKPEDINWDKLPEQFVLKCTHDSGGLVICKDKSSLDKRAAVKKLNKCLRQNFYMAGREWPYKDVPKRIIAEKYMEDEFGELRDYKFFCFNGTVKALFIATDRQTRDEPYFDFFDENFNHLDLRHGHPNAPELPAKPRCFEEMKQLASKLSEGFPQLRVDFYEVNGKVFFGELTFFHHTGMVEFDPAKWNNIFGSWIDLPIS